MNPAAPRARRPGRPPRPDSAAMRERLLDTATALFAEQGVAATTIAHIAARAGVTPAMVHYYFRNRGQLIDAVVDERLAPVIAHVWEPVPADDAVTADPAAAARECLVLIVQRLAHSAAQRPWLPPLWLHEVVNEAGQLRERVLRHLPAARLHRLTALIEQGQRQGVIRPGVEPRLAVLSILGLTLLPLATANLWRRLWPEGARAIDADAIAAHALAVLAGGLFIPHPPGAGGSA